MSKENKQDPKKVSPYEEMNLPRKEVDDMFDRVEDYNEDIPEEDIRKKTSNNPDYLDNIPQNYNQNQPRYNSEPLMFNDEGKENLIVNLLKVDWDRIEHILRGHKPKVDKQTGDEYFVKINDHYLNDYGVNSILHFLSLYLGKDIKLGRYTPEQVEMIMKNFAKQFTDYFYDNIEEFGLDTPKKKKMSKMFVQSVIDLVDASYSCAIGGKTIELMLKQFSVMQQEPLTEVNYNPNQQQRQKPSVLQRIFG